MLAQNDIKISPPCGKITTYKHSCLKKSQVECEEVALSILAREDISEVNQQILSARLREICSRIFGKLGKEINLDTSVNEEPRDEQLETNVQQLNKEICELKSEVDSLRKKVPEAAKTATINQLRQWLPMELQKVNEDNEMLTPHVLIDDVKARETIVKYEKVIKELQESEMSICNIVEEVQETYSSIERALKRPRTQVEDVLTSLDTQPTDGILKFNHSCKMLYTKGI